jgi:hypothetical protein
LASRVFVLALVLCVAASCQPQERPAGGSEPEAAAALPNTNSVVTSVVPADVPYLPLTAEERWKLYFRNIYLSPGGYMRAAAAGLLEQWKGEPPEWEQGMRGYARRAASSWGRFTLTASYEAAGSAVLGQDVRYVRCRCSGVGQRVAYVISASLFTRKRNGRIVPAVARIAGQFGAGYSAKLWLPESYQSDSRIARSVLFQTGYQGMVNILREFTPELKQAFRRK